MTIFNFDGSEQSVRSYTYNLRKQVTKASGLFAPGEPETYHIYKYDENGLPLMSQGAVVNSVGTLQWPEDLATYPCRYYSYEFDERGNWITRYERKEPDSPEAIVLKRTIVYY